jgi:hypothetical protein
MAEQRARDSFDALKAGRLTVLREIIQAMGLILKCAMEVATLRITEAGRRAVAVRSWRR